MNVQHSANWPPRYTSTIIIITGLHLPSASASIVKPINSTGYISSSQLRTGPVLNLCASRPLHKVIRVHFGSEREMDCIPTTCNPVRHKKYLYPIPHPVCSPCLLSMTNYGL